MPQKTSNTPRIISSNPNREYYFKEGCHILELSNSLDDPSVSIAQARVEPGATTRWHKLRDTTERYVITQGQGYVEVGELPPRLVSRGDVVIIPPDCRQRISNQGNTDLIFLAICSPRFELCHYCDLED